MYSYVLVKAYRARDAIRDVIGVVDFLVNVVFLWERRHLNHFNRIKWTDRSVRRLCLYADHG